MNARKAFDFILQDKYKRAINALELLTLFRHLPEYLAFSTTSYRTGYFLT